MNFEITDSHISSVIERKIIDKTQEEKDESFFVANLSDVIEKHRLWTEHLPRVKPFYAVKCNDDPGVLETLAKLGTGFDCASKSEIQKIRALKVSQDRIIYANPCKQSSHIKYAAKHKVARMTFDNETELLKMKNLYPTAELVLRILPPEESKAQCQLGMKYGAPMKTVPALLQAAKQLDLNVIGISFHVGSGCMDPLAFPNAVKAAHAAFGFGRQAGYEFSLLDIGGGFPGQSDSEVSFEEICTYLKPALDTYFPAGNGVDIIAEPGRFYVASAFHLVVNIIAKRAIPQDKTIDDELTPNDQPAFMYYINDGVYGSFNCLMYDHATVKPTVMNALSPDELMFTSSVWGPTCDGLDQVLERVELPELFTGDWLLFKDMGAYSLCAGSEFNGMPKPVVHRVMHQDTWWPSSNEDTVEPLEKIYVPGYENTELSTKRRARRAISEA